MKPFKEEIGQFLATSNHSERSKGIFRRRLEDFSQYLAEICNTSSDYVHLEQVYETVNQNGETLFFSSLDVKLVDQYFYSHLHKSYHWLYNSRRSLQNMFLYLYRRYDFPILTEEMIFKLDEHKQKPPKKEHFVPTRHNLLKFLQSLIRYSTNLDRDLLYFVLMMSTGSRPSEIIYVKVKNIDYLNGTIFVEKTKNKTSKYIILREGVGAVLQRYVEKCELSNEDFLINENGEPLKLSELQELFNIYLQEANLPRFTLHKLRHSFATIMAESGAEVLVIQQLLGHKKINSTSTYIEPNYVRNRGMELQVNKDIYKHIRKEKFKKRHVN